MPGYRFCRSDDIALLANALNRCYVVHFEDELPLSVEDFKGEIRELDVWCSSCMEVSADGEQIGVVTGAKRERETLIHRIGIHPDYQGQGHARHMLESLSQKLAVLGPPRIVAEVPQDLPAACALFESVGYHAELSLADFVLTKTQEPLATPGDVARVTLDDLLSCGALDASPPSSWERAVPTLQNRKDQLRGFAIASDTRVEAYVLYRDLPAQGRRELVAFGGAGGAGVGEAARDATDGLILLKIVIRVACQAGALATTVPKIGDERGAWRLLESLGFESSRVYTRYAATADSNTGS